MQFDGGYRYPSNRILTVLTILILVITAIVWLGKSLSVGIGLTLFLGLQGTALVAAAYTPVGLVPPQGNIWKKVKWLFQPQGGTAVSFDQRMFYGGLFLIFLSYVITALVS